MLSPPSSTQLFHFSFSSCNVIPGVGFAQKKGKRKILQCPNLRSIFCILEGERTGVKYCWQSREQLALYCSLRIEQLLWGITRAD